MTTAAINYGGSAQAYGKEPVYTTPQQNATLSQQQFLQLLAVQFQQQDPFNPTSDTEFMAQMAQFSALEQMSELNREFSRFRSDNEFNMGSQMIGKEVIIKDDEGALFTGTVDALHKSGNSYYVDIGGALFSIRSVQSVYQPIVAPEQEAG